MDIIKVKANGTEFEFICQCRGTRSGFAHDCNLFVGGRELTEAHCHYINRTWEVYEYQSVCVEAINNLIQEHKEAKKIEFCEKYEWKRLTQKRADILDQILECDDYMKTLKECKANLLNKIYY